MRKPTKLFIACSFASMVTGLQSASADWYTPRLSPGEQSRVSIIMQRAMEAYNNGDDNACINLCRQGENVSHGDKNLLHLEALAFAHSGDNYNAMTKFRAALTIDYNFVPCRNNYGMFLRKTGKTNEAEKMFAECIKIDPHYPDAYYHLGEITQEKGDIDKAIELYDTAVRLNPNYVDAQRDLGLAIYERYKSGKGGDISTSIEKLTIAAQLMPDNPIIHYHLGNIYSSAGKLDQAEAEMRTALTKDAKCAPAHWELARLRYYRGDENRALWEISYAAKVAPNYTESSNYPKVDPYQMGKMAARCYELTDQLDKAIEQWRTVASMERNNVETNKHVEALIKQAKSEARHKGGKKGEPADPVEVKALVRKGIGQVDDGDLDGAKQTFQHTLDLDPSNFDATQNFGAVLEATGDLNGAQVQYQKAMGLEPTFDGLLYNFAYLLEKMNLASDAGVEYQKFHELAGKYPYDPKHIVTLQQEEIRQRAHAEQVKKRGY